MWRAVLTAAVAIVALSAAEPVWIDAGGPDDEAAIGAAFRSAQFEVRGVSANFGEAPLERVLPRIAALLPPGAHVVAGAASAADLGHETEAVTALTSALRRERLSILMLGAATTVATVLELHPELARRVRRVVAVAGRRRGQTITAEPGGTAQRDLNFEMNPQAFHVLLKSHVPLTLIHPVRGASTQAIEYLEGARRCSVEPAEIRRGADDTGPGPDKPYLVAGPDVRSKFRVEYCATR